MEVTGIQNLAVRAHTGTNPSEGAIAGSDPQTRSKGQAIPICLGPLDKPVFDERFAAPRGDRQFIEGPKELNSCGMGSVLEHIIRSAQKYGAKSKVYNTPKAMTTSLDSNLPYPIGTGTVYSAGEQSTNSRNRSNSQQRSAGQVSSSKHQLQRGTSRTPHSSGDTSQLRNLVNHPDERTFGLFFHHQTSTCTENVKFRAVKVVLRPGTSSAQ